MGSIRGHGMCANHWTKRPMKHKKYEELPKGFFPGSQHFLAHKLLGVTECHIRKHLYNQ